MSTVMARPLRKPQDYATDQEVRWCPGCGDYAILKAVQKTLASYQADPDNTVFISGIGCAARFPYYIESYGFHTIHGRAAPVATGLKLANPELDVWLVSGDGDSLSIGGNHLVHLLRRNVALTYLLLNNEVYGLTKGQYSPTSRVGSKSPSSPQGSTDRPVHALSLALGAGARFVARATDTGGADLVTTLQRANRFNGTGFVEILQNCIVYNDAVFDAFTDKRKAASNVVKVTHGEALRFGNELQYGLRLNVRALELEVIDVKSAADVEQLLVHDETNLRLAQMLAALDGSSMPMAMGVLYCEPGPTHHDGVLGSQPPARATLNDLNNLLRAGTTWRV